MFVTPDIIITRQHAEVLLEAHLPLPSGQSPASVVRQVAGFAYLSILALSSQAFSITIEEGNTADGPFAQTATFASGSDGAGQQRVCERFFPCGAYARITLTNLGIQSRLDFTVIGVPA
jgi:hypothetical protein